MPGKQYDVIVVGAGPAGAASAALLARRGFHVLLVDRAHFPRPKACAEYMSPGVADVLLRTGLESALDGLRPLAVTGMEIVSPRGGRLRVKYERSGAPMIARTLSREVLDAALVRQAVREGAELSEGFVVREPITEGSRVCGVSGTVIGEPTAVRGRLTLIADGARSILSRSLALASTPRWPVRLGLVAHFEGPVRLRDGFGQMHVDRGGYCGVAPLPDGCINVAMVVPTHALQRARLSATAFMDAWIASHLSLRELLADCTRITPVRGLAPLGSRVRRAWAPGGLLVGDSAGFFDPFTGEGIYRALRGAELVTDVASRFLERGDASAVQLASYDSMRREAFRGKEAVTALVQAFVQYPSLLEYALPRLARRPSAVGPLSSVLGDLVEAGQFLNPRTLWTALRP